MKKYLSDYAFLFLVAGGLVLLDQVTKSWIRSNLAMGEVLLPELWITQFARIVHWKNYGAAFGMFQSLGNVFMVLSFIVSGIIIYYFPQVPRQDRLIRLAMAMLLAGALGNLIDRLYQGYVTDFISILDIPVFNVADACISCGVVLLFVGMWLQERKKNALLAASVAETPATPDSSSALNPEDQRGE